MVLAGGNEDTDGVVEGSLGFVEDVLAGAAEDDGAGLVLLAARELDDLVFTDNDLLDLGARAKDVRGRVVEGRENF